MTQIETDQIRGQKDFEKCWIWIADWWFKQAEFTHQIYQIPIKMTGNKTDQIRGEIVFQKFWIADRWFKCNTAECF